MFNRKSLLVAVGAILGLVVTIASANAWVNNSPRTTYLTFSGPVGLPGVTLGAGTYVFELAGSNLDIVRVRKERSAVFYMGFTEQVSRPSGLSANHQISFGESAPGTAAPIKVWYPEGDSMGHRFIYKTR